MRRLWAMVCAGMMLVTAGGCVAVSAKNNRWCNDLEAVSAGDRVYVVNTRTGQVALIDTEHPVPMSALSPHDEPCE